MIRQTLAILSLVFVSACGATSSHSELSAAHKKYYKVDLTKVKNWTTEVNLMDDDMDGSYDGLAVQLPIKKELYQAKMIAGEESQCKVESIENNAGGSLIKVTVSVETDNGESFCDLAITARDGRKGKVHFYEVGT